MRGFLVVGNSEVHSWVEAMQQLSTPIFTIHTLTITKNEGLPLDAIKPRTDWLIIFKF